MDDDDTDAYQREKSFCDLARCFFFTRADFEGTKLATVTKKVIETTPQISLVQNNSVCLWSVFFLFRFWSEIVFRVVVLFWVRRVIFQFVCVLQRMASTRWHEQTTHKKKRRDISFNWSMMPTTLSQPADRSNDSWPTLPSGTDWFAILFTLSGVSVFSSFFFCRFLFAKSGFTNSLVFASCVKSVAGQYRVNVSSASVWPITAKGQLVSYSFLHFTLWRKQSAHLEKIFLFECDKRSGWLFNVGFSLPPLSGWYLQKKSKIKLESTQTAWFLKKRRLITYFVGDLFLISKIEVASYQDDSQNRVLRV